MLERCKSPNYKQAHLYFSKGIRVCERWESFDAFLSDMGDKPSQSHSLDRIDGTKGYEPGNCRWADNLTQGRNTTRVKLIEFNGEFRCLPHWAEVLGIKKQTLKSRIKAGWSIEESFSKKPNYYGVNAQADALKVAFNFRKKVASGRKAKQIEAGQEDH